MSPLILAAALLAQPVSTSSATAALPVTSVEPAPAVAVAAGSLRGPVGVGLVATGAGLAAAGTVTFTLVQALGTPDKPDAPVLAGIERFTAISGFLGIALASVSAVLMVVGAALTLSDSGDGNTAPPNPAG
jgi:hypothetical protein